MDKRPELIHNICPFCGSEMTWDVMDFLICPNCKGESHPDIDTPKTFTRLAAKAAGPTQYMKVHSKKSGSRKSKGKNTSKEKLKKQTTGVLFQKLFVNT